MYIRKIEKTVMNHYNLSKEIFFNTYLVVLFDKQLKKKFYQIEYSNIYEKNLYLEEAKKCVEKLKNDNDVKSCFISAKIFYINCYYSFLESKKRIESIGMLRNIISNNTPVKARLIFSKLKNK